MLKSRGASRRCFLKSAAMAGGYAALAAGPVWAAESLDPRVAALVAGSILIDTHNHVDVPLTAAEEPGAALDIQGEMKRQGLGLICMAFATDYQPGNPWERFQHGMAAMDRELARNGMQRALSVSDVQLGKPTVVQAIEGAHFLEGKLERVAIAHQRGLRHFGLLHDSDASVPLGDVYTNPPRYGGLTEFGANVVRECNRLGILIDLAHCDLQTTRAALKLSTKPLLVSHTGLDTRLGSNPQMAKMMRPRLISKEQAQMVADAGGAVGVWTHLADTPLEFAQNIRAMVEVIGVDHVCIGTDTKLTEPTPHPGWGRPGPRVGERTRLVWADQQAGFYYVVVDAMLKCGFTQSEIARIGGGNYLRIFAAATARKA